MYIENKDADQLICAFVFTTIQSVCRKCRKGERINPKLRCKTCSGQKVVEDHKILAVHIDKGRLQFSFLTQNIS